MKFTTPLLLSISSLAAVSAAPTKRHPSETDIDFATYVDYSGNAYVDTSKTETKRKDEDVDFATYVDYSGAAYTDSKK
jgi:hypothetical protein